MSPPLVDDSSRYLTAIGAYASTVTGPVVCPLQVPLARRAGPGSRGRYAGALGARCLKAVSQQCALAAVPAVFGQIFGNAPTTVLRSVDVTAVIDVHHRHYPVLVIDPVDDAVGAAPRAEPVVHRREEPLANSVRLSQERTGDELVGCRRNGLRQNLA